MSGTSYSAKCPKCSKDMDVYSDWKPYEYSNGECAHCGFYYLTTEGQCTLKELNELRKNLELKPLIKLPEIDLD